MLTAGDGGTLIRVNAWFEFLLHSNWTNNEKSLNHNMKAKLSQNLKLLYRRSSAHLNITQRKYLHNQFLVVLIKYKWKKMRQFVSACRNQLICMYLMTGTKETNKNRHALMQVKHLKYIMYYRYNFNSVFCDTRKQQEGDKICHTFFWVFDCILSELPFAATGETCPIKQLKKCVMAGPRS